MPEESFTTRYERALQRGPPRAKLPKLPFDEDEGGDDFDALEGGGDAENVCQNALAPATGEAERKKRGRKDALPSAPAAAAMKKAEPTKIAGSLSSPTTAATEENAEPKKRGRPKKNKEASPSAPAVTVVKADPTPKKRGRPPKKGAKA